MEAHCERENTYIKQKMCFERGHPGSSVNEQTAGLYAENYL
jgi:hypothetical protein